MYTTTPDRTRYTALHPLSGTSRKRVLPFGKFRGRPIADVPKKYVLWLAAYDRQGITEAQKWVRKHHLMVSEEARRVLEFKFPEELEFEILQSPL